MLKLKHSPQSLHLDSLDDAISECRRLIRVGYVTSGNWSLGQICYHIRTTIDANMNGYPTWMAALGYPLRPFLRVLVLPRLLSGRSLSGVKTARMFVPPVDLDDAAEVELLAECIKRFQQNRGPLHPHPGFGSMNHRQFERFHAAHAAHHLNFLTTDER